MTTVAPACLGHNDTVELFMQANNTEFKNGFIFVIWKWNIGHIRLEIEIRH